jgi:predicted RNase H-like nuclease
MSSRPTTALGVDGWSRGWVGIELHDCRFAAAYREATLDALISRVKADAIGVDIPLGLLDRGWRNADLHAKKLLGTRSSRVFLTPPRSAFDELAHASASARCRELNQSGFSIQAWALKRKLLEANMINEAGSVGLHEVHPEVSFAAMGLPPHDRGKKTWAGQCARRRLLHGVGIDLPDEVGAAGIVPPDDVLDAAAAAWSAHRIATAAANSLPDPPQLNERGQRLAIWY